MSKMNPNVNQVVIAGGGTAGWLSAAILAADRAAVASADFHITLIESPDIAPIGVGEGTWPSMRATLKRIGVSETDFIRECSASFKQGSKFVGWTHGKSETYYHPFSLPQGYDDINLAADWQAFSEQVSFADAVSAQSSLCEHGLAPKQIATPEYAPVANYGYHLDSAKFSSFLQKHCVEKLGVTHVLANISEINAHPNGDIASLSLQSGEPIEGDLFIDCTGFASLLLGQHYQIPLVSQQDILFNDTALAAQVPYARADDPVASATLATAQTAGWIWDIGLPHRRGVGYVYSSAHITREKAEQQLREYIAIGLGVQQASALEVRELNINPGYRQKLWHKNCVGIGIAAGFIEPLEASALVLVELSATMLSDQLPVNREVMDILAKRFNDRFLTQWQRIVEFLKLHYILTQRNDSDYWRDHCDQGTIPERLQELVTLWRHQCPWHQDGRFIDDMFPPASFQYVYYGMGGKTHLAANRSHPKDSAAKAMTEFQNNRRKIEQLLGSLPSNRELINKIMQYGLPKI